MLSKFAKSCVVILRYHLLCDTNIVISQLLAYLDNRTSWCHTDQHIVGL